MDFNSSYSTQVLGLERANSSEFDAETPNPVVIFMPEVVVSSFSKVIPLGLSHLINETFLTFQGSKTHMGSTMRLGSRRTLFQTPDCLTAKL